MNNNKGSASGCLAVVGLVVSAIYLSNISMGIIEIPDNLPLVGNLDEVFFSGVLFASLARLGIHLPGGGRRTETKMDPNNSTHQSGEVARLPRDDDSSPPGDS